MTRKRVSDEIDSNEDKAQSSISKKKKISIETSAAKTEVGTDDEFENNLEMATDSLNEPRKISDDDDPVDKDESSSSEEKSESESGNNSTDLGDQDKNDVLEAIDNQDFQQIKSVLRAYSKSIDYDYDNEDVQTIIKRSITKRADLSSNKALKITEFVINYFLKKDFPLDFLADDYFEEAIKHDKKLSFLILKMVFDANEEADTYCHFLEKSSDEVREKFYDYLREEIGDHIDLIEKGDLYLLQFFEEMGHSIVEAVPDVSDSENEEESYYQYPLNEAMRLLVERYDNKYDREVRSSIVNCLLRRGASPNQRNEEGLDVIDILHKEFKFEESCRLILKEVEKTLLRYQFLHKQENIFEALLIEDNLIDMVLKAGTNQEAFQEIKDELKQTRKQLKEKDLLSSHDIWKYLYLERLIQEQEISFAKILRDRKGNPVEITIDDFKQSLEMDGGNAHNAIYTYIDFPIKGFYSLPGSINDKESILFHLISSLIYLNARQATDDIQSNKQKINLSLIKKLDPERRLVLEVLKEYRDKIIPQMRKERLQQLFPKLNKITEMVPKFSKGDLQGISLKKINKQITKILTDIKNLSDQSYVNVLGLALGFKEELNDYYGVELSDDSDIEEEKAFARMTNLQQTLLKNSANKLSKKAASNELISNSNKSKFKKGELRLLSELSNKPSQNIIFSKDAKDKFVELPSIEERTEEIEKDLRRLNYLFMNRQLNEDTIKQISTQFVVAQYRGISYNIADWGQPMRQIHRKYNEIGKPFYSLSVLHRAGVIPVDLVKGLTQEKKNELYRLALELRDQLITLHHSGCVASPFKEQKNNKDKSGEEFFDHAGFALQDRYSKNIADYHRVVEEKLKEINKNQSLNNPEDIIFTAFFNAKNAFISTGDTPYHALKYAYGIKFYEGEKHKRLRPCYHQSGKPERPYSGKVYVSLHPPLDYLPNKGAMHVPSLNETGKLRVDEEAIPELETTFPAFLGKDKIVLQHVAKYPSFEGEYKQIYLYKYGLTKEHFELFKEQFAKTKPHTPERKIAQNLLSIYLCTYHEVSLIAQAHQVAQTANQVLIYRDEFGNFSFYPAKIRQDSKKEHGKAAYAMRAAKKQESKSQINNKQNFFQQLLQNYQLKYYSSNLTPLYSILQKEVNPELTEERINKEISSFTDIDKKNIEELCHLYPEKEIISPYIEIFYGVCLIKNCSVILHNPRFKEGKLIISPHEKMITSDVNFYYGGGQSFSFLKEKQQDLFDDLFNIDFI